MRTPARFGLGLCGLALVAAPMAKAADDRLPAGATVVAADPSAMAPAPKHQHKGLFGSRHCVECQRARAKQRDGVDVPPPPATLPAGAIPGRVVHSHGQAAAPCAACEAAAAGGTVVMGPTTVVSGPVTVVEGLPAGHATVGGPAVADASAPGHAVVGPGMDAASMAAAGPAPVGVSRAAMAAAPRTAALGGRPGSSPYDPAVRATSIPPAQTGIEGAEPGRPRILGHLFGVSAMRRDFQDMRAARQNQGRDAHAAISYDDPNKAVTDLPASMVYGRGQGH
ncbi:hypothetical protein OJF2_10250 [Aquisphaera giovannonii]|uniref:PAAR motif protein n=1 Tax=Aquisphaera giovannonii TaxID=406548 RepID=A0A5B9VWC7_9BACT|nr:hypothetical protein [Aquisphaera giovannonii]QEH32548.1 hypothetical protein OJF2_10250 [Aquisphaera giovannonii]